MLYYVIYFLRNNEIGIFVHYLYKDIELILNPVVIIFSSSSLMEECMCCMNKCTGIFFITFYSQI